MIIPTRYRHNLLQFEPVQMLAMYGITPLSAGSMYASVYAQVRVAIEVQVETTSRKLNEMLKEEFGREMLGMFEYLNFPRYIQTMNIALSNPVHVGTFYDKNVIQAKFVDFAFLGGVEELVEIQHEVYPERGTLAGWIRLYNAWLEGIDDTYDRVANQRLDIMESSQIAPFLELVDGGNDSYAAYPKNGASNVFGQFVGIYKRQMLMAYYKTINIVRMLTMVPTLHFGSFTSNTRMVDGVVYSGYEWVSKKGNTVFVIAGTENVSTATGLLQGRGFLFAKDGVFLKRFFGRLPKI